MHRPQPWRVRLVDRLDGLTVGRLSVMLLAVEKLIEGGTSGSVLLGYFSVSLSVVPHSRVSTHPAVGRG